MSKLTKIKSKLHKHECHEALDYIQELLQELKRVTKKASVMEQDNFKLITKLEEANKEVDKAYEAGYNEATSEACKEIHKNYTPNK